MGNFVLAELAKPSANAGIVSLLGKISADRANLAGQDDENGLALEHINRALRYGEEWSYYKSRAWYKYKLGDIEGALADAQRCVSIQPLATKCHNYVASRLIDLGQVEESKQSFDIAKRIDEDGDPWERWAARKIARQASQYFPNQLDKALAIYEHALSLDENYLYARYWRGDVLDRLGRQEEAMSDILTVLKSKPEHLGARKAVDRILLPQGRFDEIIASWNELLQYNPDNSEALLERSGTYYHKGRRDLARADVERACELKNERACDTLAKYFNGS